MGYVECWENRRQYEDKRKYFGGSMGQGIAGMLLIDSTYVTIIRETLLFTTYPYYANLF